MLPHLRKARSHWTPPAWLCPEAALTGSSDWRLGLQTLAMSGPRAGNRGNDAHVPRICFGGWLGTKEATAKVALWIRNTASCSLN